MYEGIYTLGFHNVAVARINRVVALRGGFSQEKVWAFRRDKKVVIVNNKEAILR